MDLLDVADLSQVLSIFILFTKYFFESIFGALQVSGRVALNLLGVREGSQNSLQSWKP